MHTKKIYPHIHERHHRCIYKLGGTQKYIKREREEKKIVTSLYVFCKAFNKPKNPPILERVKQMHAYPVLHIHVRQYLFALFQKYEYISI